MYEKKVYPVVHVNLNVIRFTNQLKFESQTLQFHWDQLPCAVATTLFHRISFFDFFVFFVVSCCFIAQ